jgi:hypothetical protein
MNKAPGWLPLPTPQLATLLLAGLVLVACGPREAPPTVPSVIQLTEDPILLSRVLEKCNARPDQAGSPECVNARAAAERREAAAGGEAAREARAEQGFEMAREARRRAEEAATQAHDATRKRMDPYDLPVEPGADKAPPP